MTLTVLLHIKQRKVKVHLNVRPNIKMFGLSGISKYLAATIVALTIAGYILFNALVSAKTEIKTLEEANKLYIAQLEQNKAVQKSFEASHQSIIIHYQNLEEKHRKHSSKENVVVAKPRLVEKLANKKFKNQEREMACLTGNQSKC